MTTLPFGATAPASCPRTARKNDRPLHGNDFQDRFGLLLLGYNAAHHDVLDATGPSTIRPTEDTGIYEATIQCATSLSTLTASVTCNDGQIRLSPIDFRTTFRLPFLPDFSYDRGYEDAHVIRMMTGWLERAFLVHEAAILEGIDALPPRESAPEA